jgi:DNA helicase-2/ATP-dependent DNA helicase PcrA
MTLHAAKGLEFPVVYMIALEERILPHERSQKDPLQLEEERRLAFVGITRAKEELQVSYAVRRSFRGQTGTTIPSLFLSELKTEDAELLVAALDPSRKRVVESDEELQADGHAARITRHRPPQRTAEAPRAALRSVVTAAELAGHVAPGHVTGEPCDVEGLEEGMTVSHPEYGLGKIVSLSGSGNNKRATVGFAMSGEKTFVLAYSKLRPHRR